MSKKNLEAGRRFERKVRKDLEKNNIVTKWMNNIQLIGRGGKLIPAKQGPFRKTSTGFPDFLVISHQKDLLDLICYSHLTLVEAKSNGYLDPIERKKCEWLLKNQIIEKILIAKKGKRGQIIYNEFSY